MAGPTEQIRTRILPALLTAVAPPPPRSSPLTSLRSRGEVDVEKIARHHGGGGHKNAAGFSLTGDGEAVRLQVAEALGAALSQPGEADA